MWLRKELLVLILLLVVTIPAAKSLFTPGGFTSHDLTHHVIRQISMDKLLSEGQFPPRWSGDLASGYGYPVFLFNYPLPGLIGQIFHKLGFNFVDSVKAVLFLSLIASTLGMYLFLKSFLNSFLSAFLGSLFYLYAPIHLIVVYVSGAPGASLGLTFPPFIFWSIVKLWQNDKRFVLVGALSFAGLILAHNVTALIFAPLIFAFGWVIGGRRVIREIGGMILLGLGLSAWFWLPALLEKQYIRYDQLMKGVYQDQFPSLRQIIYSPWGYGLSHPQNPQPGDMSYQIGLIHILVMLIMTVLMWVVKEVRVIGRFTLAFFIIGIFFMLKISLPLWDNLPFLSYVQFPVRLLVVPVFSASLAAALVVKYAPFRRILFVGLLILVLYANRNHLRINQRFDPGEDYYLSLSKITSTTSFDENLPIWVKKIKTDPNHGKFTFVKGEGEVNLIKDKSTKVLAEIETASSATLRFNQYYFPGWEIKVDGKKIDFNYLSDREDSGLPIFDIQSGKHRVEAKFENTPVRNLGDFITIITVIIALAITVFRGLKVRESI